jgi:hypothetical protein
MLFPTVKDTTIRTQLVRILHLHYKTTCFPWKNEWFRGDSDDSLDDSLKCFWGPRQRTRR